MAFTDQTLALSTTVPSSPVLVESNDFSWRVGMSGVWADSGAGHGVFQEAIRIASRQFEDATGKVMFEYTYATNDLNISEVEQSRTTANGTFSRSHPAEVTSFVQYSKPKNLVEFIVQMSSGALEPHSRNLQRRWIGDPILGRPTGTSQDNRASRAKVR